MIKILFVIATFLQIAHADELPFREALRAMVDHNVLVQVQQTKLSASKSQQNAAIGAFTPQIYLQAQEQRWDGNSPSVAGSSIYPTEEIYTANAKWNLFRSGADIAGLRAANRDQSYQESTLEDSYIQAEQKSALALLDLIEKKQIAEAYKRSEESVGHFLEIARARFNKSLLPKEETDKVALDASNAEAKRADAEIGYNNARAAVEALLGHTRVSTEWPWEKNLSLDQVKDFINESGRKAAIEQRPDFRAAREFVESQDSLSRSFFRAMGPSVDLTYSVGELHSRGQTVSSWQSLATLTIPLWSGLKDHAAYRTQVEAKYAAEFRLHQLERDVQGLVEAAQANFRLSVQQYQVRTRNLTLARHIMDQDAARFKLGRADANELNLDLDRVTIAEILAVQGIRQAHVAYMELLHAFGRRVQ